MADPWAQFVRPAEPERDRWSQFVEPPDAVPAETGAVADIVKSAGVGAAQGGLGLATMPGNLEMLARGGLDWALEKFGRPGFAGAMEKFDTAMDAKPYTVADAQKDVEGVTGPFYQPKTEAGKVAKTVGEFAPGAAFPGGPAQRVVMNWLAPAAGSEIAGRATDGTAYETPARIAGAVVAPTAVRAVGRAATAPFPATPLRQQHVNTMEAEGVDLSAGNRTGSRPLQWIESTARDYPFSSGPATELAEGQLRQYTAAALRRIGERGDDAGPDVMRQARRRIGNEFERVTTANNMDFTTPAGQAVRQNTSKRMQAAEIEFEKLVPTAAQRQFVADFTDDVNWKLLSGRMEGAELQAWRSRLGTMANNHLDDPQFSSFLGQAQRILDDAFEASIGPADRAAWRQARSQWGHLLEMQYAMGRGSEAAANGMVTPQALRMADQNANARGYVEGTGRYADIARAGVATMPQLPNSGTPARLGVTKTLAAVPPGLFMRAMVSPFMQGYLGGQAGAPALRGMQTGPAIAAQASTDAALPQIKKFEDALKLKPGTLFLNPDGDVLVAGPKKK